MEEVHHLMVRRRFKDGFDGIWLGYDEFYGTRATGRIVMGWHVDKKTGEIVNHYAKEPPELKAQRINKKTTSKPTVAEVNAAEEVVLVALEKFVDELEDLEIPQPTVPATVPLTGATERYVVTFDWHYGSERMVLDSLEEAAPWRKAVEDKFGHLNPTNWKIVKELVVSEDVEWLA